MFANRSHPRKGWSKEYEIMMGEARLDSMDKVSNTPFIEFPQYTEPSRIIEGVQRDPARILFINKNGRYYALP